MTLIYENEIKALGSEVGAFEGMILLFGEGAPDALRDYCCTVSVNALKGEIKPGQILKFDDNEYQITAVGAEAPHTLVGLGHCTINFSGQTEVDLPGTIYVENKPMPTVAVGTKIQIVEA